MAENVEEIEVSLQNLNIEGEWSNLYFFSCMYFLKYIYILVKMTTFELEKDGKLPFLNVEIFRSSGKFSTSVYRKPTFTGLFTNFHSFIPLAYKRSLVSCLLHRIFNLCSTYENFHVQLEVVWKLFN